MPARKDDFGVTPLSQLKAQSKYDENHTTGFYMKLNLRYDQDILQWLWKQENKQGAIKRLIRKEIEATSPAPPEP